MKSHARKVALTEPLSRHERRAIEHHAAEVGGVRGEQFRALGDDPKGRGWLRVEGYTRLPAERRKAMPVNTLRMKRQVGRRRKGRHSGEPLTAEERRIVAAWSAETHDLAGVDVPTGEILAMLAASSAGRAKLRGLIARNTVAPTPSPRAYPSLERTGPRDEVAEARVIKALERLRSHAAQ